MNWYSIRALVGKDFSLFFRNKFFALITVGALIMYIVVYFLMPANVDETLRIGFFVDSLPEEFTQQLDEEDWKFIMQIRSRI